MVAEQRILIADDHAILRDGLAAIIDYQPDMTVVARADNGKQAFELFLEHRPDLVVMDLRMPEWGGVEAIRAIREAQPDARIVVLTTYDGDEDIYRALEAGAKGYLLKDAGQDELMGAIRSVVQGGTHIPPGIAARLAERTMSGPPLTARELEVLAGIARGQSNKEIGNSLFISEGTVKTHVNSILGKLGAADRTQAVTIALKRGILQL